MHDLLRQCTNAIAGVERARSPSPLPPPPPPAPEPVIEKNETLEIDIRRE